MRAPRTLPDPPRKLRKPGRELWDRIQSEFFIEDAAGIEILLQACQALDRAESLAATITAEGEVVWGSHGAKSHPAVRDELQARALVVRMLQKLGVVEEAVKPVGRPSGLKAWKGDDDAD